MPKPVLPKKLRDIILSMFAEGASSIEVFDAVCEQAIKYAKSENQLSRCIAGLKSLSTKRQGLKSNGSDQEVQGSAAILLPRLKTFESSQYEEIVNTLDKTTPGYEFEKACNPIVIDILKNYEGFDDIIDANARDNFHNPPFDFLGFKNGEPFIVEFKGSLENLNYPGETQKKRLQELLARIEGLNVALLQVRLRNSDYRILYNDELKPLFDGNPAPLEPIEDWLKERIWQKLKS